VTPAAGASFYINSHDGKQGYEDFFSGASSLPDIEARYRYGGAHDTRHCGLFSMGGYGALPACVSCTLTYLVR